MSSIHLGELDSTQAEPVTPSDDECIQQALSALQAVSLANLDTEAAQKVRRALETLQVRQDDMDKHLVRMYESNDLQISREWDRAVG